MGFWKQGIVYSAGIGRKSLKGMTYLSLGYYISWTADIEGCFDGIFWIFCYFSQKMTGGSKCKWQICAWINGVKIGNWGFGGIMESAASRKHNLTVYLQGKFGIGFYELWNTPNWSLFIILFIMFT
jgi:hypothetical protein